MIKSNLILAVSICFWSGWGFAQSTNRSDSPLKKHPYYAQNQLDAKKEETKTKRSTQKTRSKLKPQRMSTQEAKSLAEERYGGKALSAKPIGDINASKPHYRVKMIKDGRVQMVTVPVSE